MKYVCDYLLCELDVQEYYAHVVISELLILYSILVVSILIKCKPFPHESVHQKELHAAYL